MAGLYIYIELPSNNSISLKKFFQEVVHKYMPFLPKKGGAISENFILTTPEDTSYMCLSYNKDIENWREQIIKGAELMSLRIGTISNQSFFTSDRQKFDLKYCVFEKYNFYNEKGVLIKNRTLINKRELFTDKELEDTKEK